VTENEVYLIAREQFWAERARSEAKLAKLRKLRKLGKPLLWLALIALVALLAVEDGVNNAMTFWGITLAVLTLVVIACLKIGELAKYDDRPYQPPRYPPPFPRY
jgi:hypothetical protein